MIAGHDVAHLRAPNPGALTLSGTNTWVLGRSPCWIVDPGPAIDVHLDAVAAEARARGGAGGIAITHGHADHVEGLEDLRQRLDAPPVATDGELGPLLAVPTPGHSPDSTTWLWGSVACTGDAVLGVGSVFVSGQLAAYLEALEALRRRGLTLLLPGHGDPVTEPARRIGDLLEHRRERERRLLAALDRGARTVDELLDDAWSDAPPALRGAAAMSLAAHLDKLEAEGRLAEGVERPRTRPTSV